MINQMSNSDWKDYKAWKASQKEAEIEGVQENVSNHNLSAPTVGQKHEWRQEGPYVVCRSCESSHGLHIGINKKLKGFDEEGNMIIE